MKQLKLIVGISVCLIATQALSDVNRAYYRYYPYLVQLGDSYSTGFGVLPGDPPTLDPASLYCGNPTYQDYSVVPVARLRKEYEDRGKQVTALFESCGGAEIADLNGQLKRCPPACSGHR